MLLFPTLKNSFAVSQLYTISKRFSTGIMHVTTEKLKEAGVIPDVIPNEAKLTVPLTIKYNGHSHSVSAGNELAIDDTQSEPTIHYEPDHENGKYTLIMTDPDAPSRKDPKWGEYRHWVVGNIPGSNVSEGKTLTEYMGPAPPEKTGPHRYIFLLYRQSGANQGFAEMSQKRQNFKAETFATQHEMTLVGANWFLAENKN